MEPEAPPPEERPEFGPSGYLPERASRRARKIVLRAPLGLQWVVGSVLAGVAVLIAGVLFLQRAGAAPTTPWTPVAQVAAVAPSLEVVEDGVLLVAAGGRLRAFLDATEVTYCASSNRLEASDGRVWQLTGRGTGGTASLREHPVLVHDGTAYLDLTRTLPGPEPTADAVAPGCVRSAR